MVSRAQLRNRNFYLMILGDAVCIVLAFCLAYAVRLDISEEVKDLFSGTGNIAAFMAALIALKLSLFFCFGLYEGMWRYTNMRDLRKAGLAVVTSFFMTIGIIGFFYRFQGFSRSVCLLDALFTFLLVMGLRLSVREFFQLRNQASSPLYRTRSKGLKKRSVERVVVVGAGDGAEGLIRALIQSPAYKVVALLDDDPQKRGRKIHGIPVASGMEDLERVVSKFKPGLVLLAITRLEGAKLRALLERCENLQVAFKRIPSVDRIANGDFSLKELRDINYEDLLGRPPVKLEEAAIAGHLAGNVVLVTGAGGSIGSELVRQVLRFKPSRLVLVDSGEENLFNIQQELEDVFRFEAVASIVAQVQNAPLMKKIMEKHRPDVIFHAAAYKHVPLMEANPWQAVENNVMGSQSVMQCAHEVGVKRFVLVSTDKAVRPTNVMGATKRMTELIMHSVAKESETIFMAVRFGNVLGSSGSVIPTFRRQIERGGPVRVTHPEVTRYFMTTPEASGLILQAMSQGTGGEIFVLHMGSPVKISEMVRDLIYLSGKDPDHEIKIEYTGLRPGEKLYEELIHEDENVLPTSHEKVMVLKSEDSVDSGRMARSLKKLNSIANDHDGVAIKKYLKELIPEYEAQNTQFTL